MECQQETPCCRKPTSNNKCKCCCECNKPSNHHEKKRYTVKIHVKGKERPLVTKGGIPIPEKCNVQQQKAKKCDRSILKCDKQKRDNYCQTDVCQKKNQSCGVNTNSSKKLVDCHCQTSTKEFAHCGQQTSCGGSGDKCTRDCQTELDVCCDAVGVCHNRQTCKEVCCRGTSVKSKERDCQSKHNSFPFAGRTPSGHLKINPKMVSYENKEFSILVANKDCVRASVKRLVNCEGTQVAEKSHIGKSNCCTNNTMPLPCASSSSSLHSIPPHHPEQTSASRCSQQYMYQNPPIPAPRRKVHQRDPNSAKYNPEMFQQQPSPRNHYDFNEPYSLDHSNHIPLKQKSSSTTGTQTNNNAHNNPNENNIKVAGTNTSRGHADSWNYSNPFYHNGDAGTVGDGDEELDALRYSRKQQQHHHHHHQNRSNSGTNGSGTPEAWRY